jgi:hypothetical protein
MEAVRKEYGGASKSRKSVAIDHVVQLLGCHRKHAIRLLNARGKPEGARRPGPPARYGGEAAEALKRIWRAAQYPCGKRLKAMLPLWLPHDARRHGLNPPSRRALEGISAATIDRMLQPLRASSGLKGRCGTRPGTLLKTQIPIRAQAWDETRPGFFEADTVAHCGASLAGSFIWSLTLTDIASGWTENRAVWNKGAEGIVEQIADIERGLDFELRGFDCDNGSEFLNHHLVRHFQDRRRPAELTRCRPYRKNDQAHVEQKNWTHVRQLLGYERLEHPELVEPINALYRLWGLLQNFFAPTMKLETKQRIGSRIVRRHEAPATPAARLLASPGLGRLAKAQLRRRQRELDPFDLSHQIGRQLRRIRELKRRLEAPRRLTLNSPQISHPLGNILP